MGDSEKKISSGFLVDAWKKIADKNLEQGGPVDAASIFYGLIREIENRYPEAHSKLAQNIEFSGSAVILTSDIMRWAPSNWSEELQRAFFDLVSERAGISPPTP